MKYFNIAFTLMSVIFILYIRWSNKHIKTLHKANNHLLEEIAKLKIRMSQEEGVTNRNTKDLLTVFSLINVGVDVHIRGGSWAVICIAGKPEYIKFVDLGRGNIEEISYFLKKYDGANQTIDSPFWKF